MSSLGNIIQRVKELYRDRKQFAKENQANEDKVDKLVDAIEKKVERDFKRKYPDEDARADAWREIDSILEDPKTYAVPDKIRDDFEKSHSSQMSALLGGNWGSIAGVLSGFPVALWLITLLDKVFIKKSLGAKLILVSILVAAPASLGFIGNKLGFSIGALRGAVREEIAKKEKSIKNEQLIESLEYYLEKLSDKDIERNKKILAGAYGTAAGLGTLGAGINLESHLLNRAGNNIERLINISNRIKKSKPDYSSIIRNADSAGKATKKYINGYKIVKYGKYPAAGLAGAAVGYGVKKLLDRNQKKS